MRTGLIGAIEAGGTKFVLGVFDSRERLIARATVPTTTPGETFRQASAFLTATAAAHGALDALGVAAFGPIDVDPASPTFGVVQATPKMGWAGADYRAALDGLGVPIGIDTDVSGAALAEALAGAGRGCRTVAYATIGTGIGVGIARDGRALCGFSHYEMGHIRPPRAEGDPFRGLCPAHGDCVEGLAAGPAIGARWGASLSDLPPGHPGLAIEAHYLAHLFATVTLCHTPERIVVGGGVAKTPRLLDAVRERARGLLGDYLTSATLTGDLSDYIVAAALGDDAGIIGAAHLARLALGERATLQA